VAHAVGGALGKFPHAFWWKLENRVIVQSSTPGHALRVMPNLLGYSPNLFSLLQSSFCLRQSGTYGFCDVDIDVD
jgi:hypothetical protein